MASLSGTSKVPVGQCRVAPLGSLEGVVSLLQRVPSGAVSSGFRWGGARRRPTCRRKGERFLEPVYYKPFPESQLVRAIFGVLHVIMQSDELVTVEDLRTLPLKEGGAIYMCFDHLRFPRLLPDRWADDMAPFLRPEAILLTEPEIDEEVGSVISSIPAPLQAQAGDTPDSLLKRLFETNFFDGNHPAFQNIADSHWPRATYLGPLPPFSRSWSAVANGPHYDALGDLVCSMFCLPPDGAGSSVAPPHQMPRALLPFLAGIFYSGRQPFRVPHAQISTSTPPNHCELLAFYSLLGSRTSVRRQNNASSFTAQELAELYQEPPREAFFHSPHPRQEAILRSHSQNGPLVRGSDVLVYNAGPCKARIHFHMPMADPTSPAVFEARSHDWETRRVEARPCGGGHGEPPRYDATAAIWPDQIFVIRPLDDLLGPSFIEIEGGEEGHCFLFLFRWVDEAWVRDVPLGSSSTPSSPARLVAAD